MECQAQNCSHPIRTRTSDRKERACITSRVSVGR